MIGGTEENGTNGYEYLRQLSSDAFKGTKLVQRVLSVLSAHNYLH